MQIDFRGKTAIITGATQGIGENISRHLYACGARLLCTGTNKEKIGLLNKKLNKNRRMRYFYLDFLNEDSISQFISEIKKYGKIDVCINNAGINRINYIYETPAKDWDEILKVNLRGPFLLCKEAGNIMKRQGYGRIVNIASLFGVITRAKRAAYTATKAGLIGLTKTVAVDLAPYNVLVNSVSPGFILTGLTRRILTKREIESLKSSIPIGRFGTPDDVTSIVLFLSSNLNTYITGQNIIVDGGYVNI